MPWELLIGAGVTLIGVMVGGVLTRRQQERQWLRDAKASACAAALREFTRVEFDIRMAFLKSRAPEVDWAQWGAAFGALSLFFDDEVLGTAERLSASLAELEAFVHSGERDEARWRQAQRGVIQAQMTFVNAARRGIDPALRELTVRAGGPH